jgi:2,5-diketo-D-gluconate reductase A
VSVGGNEFTLRSDRTVPALAYGTSQLKPHEVRPCVTKALEIGYRLVDTAATYRNEEAVGEAIRASGLRPEVLITTKLPGRGHGRAEARRCLYESLDRLGVDHVDVYLIHWPLPTVGRFVEAWATMRELRDEGLVRVIGTSNFLPHHLEKLAAETGEWPELNQIECHLDLQRAQERRFGDEHGVRAQAWSPLSKGGAVLESGLLRSIAAKHGKTPGQVALRWHVENGVIPVPKTATPERIAANFDIFDFQLDAADMDALRSLDANVWLGPDADTHVE